MDRSACLDVIHALAEEFEEEFFTTSAVEQVKALLFQVLDLQDDDLDDVSEQLTSAVSCIEKIMQQVGNFNFNF